VYFSSCLIDVMFFAFDVAWVFFEGLPFNFPQKDVKCAEFSQWPAIQDVACGNCVALVPTAPYGGSCDRYCTSFGHQCVFAAEEVDDDCTALSRYGCFEAIENTRDMLCQCRGPETTQGRCVAYSSWPSISDTVCGDCTALVETKPVGDCESYCQSFGHRYVTTAPNEDADCPSTDATFPNEPYECDEEEESSETLCTCELPVGSPGIEEPNCDPYSAWPKVFEKVCGSCEALVPSNAVVDDTQYTTCDEYCKLFGHECQRAVDDTSCGDPDDADVIRCDVPA